MQHIVGGNEEDEERNMFASRFSDLIEKTQKPQPKQQDAKDIVENMINKSFRLVSGE